MRPSSRHRVQLSNRAAHQGAAARADRSGAERSRDHGTAEPRVLHEGHVMVQIESDPCTASVRPWSDFRALTLAHLTDGARRRQLLVLGLVTIIVAGARVAP